VAVPDVVDQNVDDATDTLEEAGFRVRRRPTPITSEDQVDTVLAQNPPAGARRKRGARIFISVGQLEEAPVETPTPTPTPTPAPG
jgi:serine/threonine-protein kinase